MAVEESKGIARALLETLAGAAAAPRS